LDKLLIQGGTPLSGDVGTNAFTVRATDSSGLYSTATMNLSVIAAPPIVMTAVLQGADLMLGWAGGIAPYQVQMTPDAGTPAWQNVGVPISASSLLVSPTNGSAFYRVYGQ